MSKTRFSCPARDLEEMPYLHRVTQICPWGLRGPRPAFERVTRDGTHGQVNFRPLFGCEYLPRRGLSKWLC